jgi:hypothetical protein
MKTCVTRRRFWSTEADNATVDVDLCPGFGTPKAAIVFFVESNAAPGSFDTSSAYRNMGIGFIGPELVSVGSEAMYITLRDNQTTADTRKSQVSRAITAGSSDGATTHYRVDNGTFGVDKISFSFANSTPQANVHLEALVWAITGDDVQVGIGATSFNGTSGGSRAYSQLSFQPDLVICSSINLAVGSAGAAAAQFSFGAATRIPFNQASTAIYHPETNPTAQATRFSTNAIATVVTGNTTSSTQSIGSITSNGWTMTASGAWAANAQYMFMAIKGQSPFDFSLLEILTPTATGTSFYTTGTGVSAFVPETLLGSSIGCTGNDAVQQTSPDADAIGMFTFQQQPDKKLYNGNGTITYSTGSATVTGTGSSFYKYAADFTLFTPSGTRIGSVSTVSSNTSLTLTSNAAVSGTNVEYCYSGPKGGHMLLGDNDNASPTETYSKFSDDFLNITLSTTPSDLLTATFAGYDTRPGFAITYNPVSTSVRRFWCLAFKDKTNANEAQRRVERVL